MRIKKRLQMSAVILVSAALIIFFVLFFALYRINKANNLAVIAGDIITKGFERVTLRNDYIRNNNERAKEQWFTKHAEIGRILKSASKRFQGTSDKKDIDEIGKCHESIGKIFSAIVANRENKGVYTDISRDVEDRLLNQLNMRVYDNVIYGRRLIDSSRKARAAAFRFAGASVFFLLIMMTGVVITNSRTMSRAITDRIRRLRDGAVRIGGGNLEHRIDVKGDDEFAELADSFNEMTEKLRGSYHNLEKEIEERKQVEEALRKSSERYRSYIEVTGQLGWTTNADGEVVEDIPSWRAYTGQTYDEAKGWGWAKALHPDDLEHTKQAWMKAVREKSSYEVEYRIRRHDGMYRHFIARGVPVFKPDGSTMEWVGTCIDITERRRAEEALRESEQRLRYHLENSPLAVIEWDSNYVVVTWSTAAEKIFGWEAGETIGKRIDTLKMIYEEDIPSVNQAIERLSGGKERTLVSSNRNYTKSGGVVECTWYNSVLLDEKGQMRSVLSLVEDITERKQAEDALRRSNSFNQSIIDSSRDCIKILDLHGRLQYMSPGGQDLLRIKDIGIYLDVPYEEFWKGTDRDAVVEVINKARQGQSGSFQGFCPTADGTPKWWDVGISPILGADGRPERLLAVSRDITERKQAEAELLKLSEDIAARNVELEAANRELDAFSYSVSHDLRTPLRSIDGFSQALIEDYGEKLDDQGKDFLRRVRAGSQRMAQLIDDLLNLSQLTRSTMSHGPVNLSVLARKVADELRETQPGRKVECIIADGVMAVGDEKLLQLVLENLLSNAWKFTGKTPEGMIEFGALLIQEETSGIGGTAPDLLTERGGREETELSPSDKGKTVYYVRDNGVGFDMSYSGKLGMPFQRLHSVDEFPGTGIGLATVKRIINRHGGRFWMVGEVGKGATAFFTLGRGLRI